MRYLILLLLTGVALHAAPSSRPSDTLLPVDIGAVEALRFASAHADTARVISFNLEHPHFTGIRTVATFMENGRHFLFDADFGRLEISPNGDLEGDFVLAAKHALVARLTESGPPPGFTEEAGDAERVLAALSAHCETACLEVEAADGQHILVAARHQGQALLYSRALGCLPFRIDPGAPLLPAAREIVTYLFGDAAKVAPRALSPPP